MKHKPTKLQSLSRRRATCLYGIGTTLSQIKLLEKRINWVRDANIRTRLQTIVGSMRNHAETIRAQVIGLEPEDFTTSEEVPHEQ